MILENYFKKHITNTWLRVNVQYSIVGVIIGLFLNVLFQLLSRNNPRDWRDILMTFVVSIIITLSITNITMASSCIVKFKFRSPFINIILNYSLMAFGVIIGSELSFVVGSFLFQTPFSDFNHWGNIRFNLVMGMLAGTILYLYQLQQDNYDIRMKDKEMLLLKLNEQKTQAELKTLQARINPHFLYNALNSITSLIHEEPAKAEEMTVNLSRLFRYSLNTQEANWATVGEELEIVKTYLDIERVRFGSRIRFDVTAGENTHGIFIPRFLLQPLVENALKHGLKDKVTDGMLRVSVIDHENTIEIRVHDNGIPFPAEMLASYGIQSTYDKLNLLYGANWQLNFDNENEKCVRIVLPKKLTI